MRSSPPVLGAYTTAETTLTGRCFGALSAGMLVLMWMAVLPIVNNPFLDDHLVYAILAVGLAAANAGDT